MKWFIKCFKQYADFGGRARRKEYWMFCLFNLMFNFLMYILFYLATLFEARAFFLSINFIWLIYLLVMFIPGIAVAVRRLHDIGISGAWYLIILTGVGAIALLVCFVIDSQPGNNKYGLNPKEDQPAEV